jgi:hypothetical protein
VGRIVIAYNEGAAQRGTYSGGSWAPTLPLENLVTHDPKAVARSTDANAASTTFLMDFGFPARLDFVALVNHNISAGATVRVRIGENADGSDALVDVTLDPANFGSDERKTLFHIIPETSPAFTAQYVLWEITDESNPKGYVQIGRHLAGPLFKPSLNLSVGAQLAIIDGSRLTRAVDGSLYADVKPKRRRLAGTFEMLSDDEAFNDIYALQRLCGLTVPIFAIYDPGLTDEALQRTVIYGDLVELSPIEIAKPTADGNLNTWQFAIEERL